MEIDQFAGALPDLAERILLERGVELDRHDCERLLERTVIGQLVRVKALIPIRSRPPLNIFRMTRLGQRVLERVRNPDSVVSLLAQMDPAISVRDFFDTLAAGEAAAGDEPADDQSPA